MKQNRQGGLLPVIIPTLVICSVAAAGLLNRGSSTNEPRTVLGQVVTASEAESGLPFLARVDTGAKTTSIHCEEFTIADPGPAMEDNVGKLIRFRVLNKQGESHWLEREIQEVATIRTSERAEQRYKVHLDIGTGEVGKKVLVSLNDRSKMTYALLIGRNFLRDDFLVNVDL